MLRRRNRAALTPDEWWSKVSGSAPDNLAGLWFGLVELAEPTPGWHMYVVGTGTFNAADETAEWAVPDYAWTPSNAYLSLPAIAALPPADAVAHAAEVVRSLTPWVDVPVAGVAVGFDDGDFEVIHP